MISTNSSKLWVKEGYSNHNSSKNKALNRKTKGFVYLLLSFKKSFTNVIPHAIIMITKIDITVINIVI